MHKPPSSKAGESAGFFRSIGGWKRRYVFVDSGMLVYTEKPNEATEKGGMTLNRIQRIGMISAAAVKEAKGPEKFSSFGWQVSTGDMSLTFVAESLAERDQFVAALQRAVRPEQTIVVPGAPLAASPSLGDTTRSRGIVPSTSINNNDEQLDGSEPHHSQGSMNEASDDEEFLRQDAEHCVITGAWMLKPPAKEDGVAFTKGVGIFGGSWNRRFVWVAAGALRYGDDKENEKVQVAISSITVARVATPTEVKQNKCPEKFQRFCWIIEGAKNILFACEDSPTRDQFVRYFDYALRRLQIAQHIASVPPGGGEDNEDWGLDNPEEDSQDAVRPIRVNSHGNGDPPSRGRHGGPASHRPAKVVARPVALVPLPHLSSFNTQLHDLVRLNREEGLVGVSVADFEGCTVSATGECTAVTTAKMVTLLNVASLLARPKSGGGASPLIIPVSITIESEGRSLTCGRIGTGLLLTTINQGGAAGQQQPLTARR